MDLTMWSLSLNLSTPVLLFGMLAWAVVHVVDSYFLYKSDEALAPKGPPTSSVEWP